MGLSNSQFTGLGMIGLIYVFALIFVLYVVPRVSAIFRPSLKTAVYWTVVILAAQALFIILAR